MFAMRDLSGRRELAAIFKQCDKKTLCFTKYRLPKYKVVIGRRGDAHISDSSLLMTGDHGYLGVTQEGYVKYQDQSKNGTYLNGRKLHGNTARLRFGDVLAFPTGLKIVFLGECIAVNRTSTSSQVKLEKWVLDDRRVRQDNLLQEAPSVYYEYQRAPRMLVKCRAEDTDIEPPIPKQMHNQQPLFLQLGPSMTMILPMLMGTIFAGNKGGSLISSGLVMMSTSSMLAIMWAIINRTYRKRQEKEVEERRTGMYRTYITEMEETLRKMAEDEHRRLLETFPNAQQCAMMPTDRSPALWNRMPTHPDFLQVRIGIGDVNIPCEIKIPKQKLSVIDDNLRNEPDRLKQKYSVLHNAPMTLSLRSESVIGVLGDIKAVLFAQYGTIRLLQEQISRYPFPMTTEIRGQLR